jgi:transcriptional regulator of acetoin/glycerol metabolism
MAETRHDATGGRDQREAETRLASSRLRFLTDEQPEPAAVRPAIRASWQRSREHRVAADRIAMPYIRDPELDTPLTRSAEPVLRSLRDRLEGQPISIILTDQTGLVLSRRTADADLDRHLDRVLLAPGFSYAESFVGTNGIGTALEAGQATHVFGHEHYAENLENLACAGVPIEHPVSGRTIGAVDLTCWRRDAEPLLLTLAKTTAEQIRQALLADSGLNELELFHAYRRACRQMSGIVIALTNDVVMINDHARAVLDPADQAALLAHAAQAVEELASGRPWSEGLLLPTGAAARLYCQQVRVGSGIAGVVVRVKLDEAEVRVGGGHERFLQMPLPGLVGHAPLWVRACHEVESAFRAGEWLAVEGEPGVGKGALLRAVQVRRQPPGRLTVLDAASAEDAGWLADVGRTLQTHVGSVVVRHVDRLAAPKLRALSALLQDATANQSGEPLWVAVTMAAGARPVALERLLRLFPSTVAVPPLRHHLEDLDLLVNFILAKLGHGGRISCSPEAMRVLSRLPFPGNVAQLHQVLQQVVQHRRSGVIQLEDLPPETQTISRRRLSSLEAIERDAIVKGLTDAHGNKVEAARSLGMSRATIYRKIHEFGIVVTHAEQTSR